MLFSALPDDIFRPLANKYRHAYERLLSRLHDGLFGLDTTRQPTRDDVMVDLEEGLLTFTRSLPDDERGDFHLTAPLAYMELIETGWLLEQREGWTTHVEMNAAAAQLLGTLCGLAERKAETFGGTFISVYSTLESVTRDAGTNAQGVAEAAQRAKQFARYARGVVGSLKDIEQSLLSQATVNSLVKTFFDDFVQRIVIGDYRKLTSVRNHPYRYRYKILEMADTIGSDPVLFQTIANSLVAQGVAETPADAQAQLDGQLRDIRLAIEAIDTFRDRIDRTKSTIERRFSNTLRYMDLVESGRAERFAKGLADIARALPDLDYGDEIPVETLLFETPSHIDGERLAKPEKPYSPVESKRYMRPKPDPLWQAFEHAKQAFDRRLRITPERFGDYVRDKVDAATAEGRAEVTAADLPPSDIEEFLIFSALRSMPVTKIPLPNGYVIEHRDGLVDNDWLICRDFALRRLSPADPESPPGIQPVRNGDGASTRRTKPGSRLPRSTPGA